LAKGKQTDTIHTIRIETGSACLSIGKQFQSINSNKDFE
jgi:hypothetical protein